MSNSRLTFFAQGRVRRLFRSQAHGPFYVRFQHRGKDIPRCLGTTDESIAKLKGKRIIEDYHLAEDETVPEELRAAARERLGLSKLRAPSSEPYGTLKGIAERYRAMAQTVPDKEDLRESTINESIRSLYLIVETRFAGGLRLRDKETAVERRADVLTGELLEEFKRGWLATLPDRNPARIATARRTVNSYIRQARAMFSDDYLPLYAGLKLPDLAAFKAVKPFRKVGSTQYVPIAQGVIDAMEAEVREAKRQKGESRNAAGELTEEARAARTMYLAFYLMLWLGMRKSECESARLEWLEQWPDGWRMAIVRRAYFKPKGIDGRVPLAQKLREELMELTEAREPMDYLLPAAHPTARHNALDALSALVRRHVGKDRKKTCHELRKHAISMKLMATRDWMRTQEFSRHSDVRTLKDHYGSCLDENMQPITSSNWRDEAPVALKVLDSPAAAAAESAA